jgi:signal transduction protein with GAF and PtsI domain
MLNDNYHFLAEFGHELLKHKSLDEGLPHIAIYAKSAIGAERCSVYVYDKKSHRLWTTLADGVERIMLSDEEGIVGLTLREEKTILENNPYSNSAFNPKIDEKTGYRTRNILATPIFDSHKKVLGVIQLLNKETGDFDESDIEFLEFFAHFVSAYLELATIHEQYEAE